MTTALYTHPAFLHHETPNGHPERIARIEAVNARLTDRAFDGLDRYDAPLADLSEVLRCHAPDYVDSVRGAIPGAGLVQLDADTWVSPGSLEAALRGVGAVNAAVDRVLTGAAANAFCAIRPPGHHAETAKPMGFCLFGNVAIATKRALDHHGVGRVAVVDFDVHHGNGTQDLLWDEGRALFVSSHQMPLWPGTGAPGERGTSDNILNVPLAPGTGGAEMRAAYEAQVFPRLEAFRPELILISAGFDAHQDDPLANLGWGVSDFAWLTERLCDLADEHAGGRVVSALEGGYDLDALADSVAAHVEVLMERGG